MALRELLKKNKTLKIVLMSATVNPKTFVDYFGGAALVTIPGRTYPVQDLCVLLAHTGLFQRMLDYQIFGAYHPPHSVLAAFRESDAKAKRRKVTGI